MAPAPKWTAITSALQVPLDEFFFLRPFGRFLVGGGRKTKVSALGRPSQNCETSYWPNGNGNFFGSRRLASFNCFSRNCWNPTNRLSVFSAEFNWICVMDFVSQMKSVKRPMRAASLAHKWPPITAVSIDLFPSGPRSSSDSQRPDINENAHSNLFDGRHHFVLCFVHVFFVGFGPKVGAG